MAQKIRAKQSRVELPRDASGSIMLADETSAINPGKYFDVLALDKYRARGTARSRFAIVRAAQLVSMLDDDGKHIIARAHARLGTMYASRTTSVMIAMIERSPPHGMPTVKTEFRRANQKAEDDSRPPPFVIVIC